MMAFMRITHLYPVIIFASYLFLQLGYTEGRRSLTDLYNSRVVKAERYERPLASSTNSWIAKVLGLKHSGVVVTLENGERWLVHKGDEYGRQSQTVVVRAALMRGHWTRTAMKRVSHSTVGDYVKAGGRTYSLLWDNCHDASKRMMRLN